MAEEGKTSVVLFLETDNDEYWVNLRENDYEKYKQEKDRIANEVIEILEQKLGNFKEHVEVVDVATPATFIRYTNNWKGSFEGWLPTPKFILYKMNKELPGLNNFYMIGQWVMPGGGLPPALVSARDVTQIICKKDKKKFQTGCYVLGFRF